MRSTLLALSFLTLLAGELFSLHLYDHWNDSEENLGEAELEVVSAGQRVVRLKEVGRKSGWVYFCEDAPVEKLRPGDRLGARHVRKRRAGCVYETLEGLPQAVSDRTAGR
jgi:hypothetical protein